MAAKDTKRVPKPTTANIKRILGDAGQPISESSTTAVRGWRHHTRGFRVRSTQFRPGEVCGSTGRPAGP
jgi:hypothetical protein